MKQLICSRCDKTVEVVDDWKYRLCPDCHAKDVDRSEVRKNVRKFERDCKSLKEGIDFEKYPWLKNYGAFRKAFRRFGEPSFEKYQQVLKDIHERERWKNIELKTKIQVRKMRKEREENKLVDAESFSLKNDDCKTYRLLRAKDQRSPEEAEFMGSHIYKCRTCTDWLESFKSYREEQDQNLPEGDIRAWDTPNDGSKGAWDKCTSEEESHEEKVKKTLGDLKGLRGTDDFKQSKNEDEHVLFGEHATDKSCERPDFADKVHEHDVKLDQQKEEYEQTRQKLKEDYEKRERKKQGYSTQEEIDEKYG